VVAAASGIAARARPRRATTGRPVYESTEYTLEYPRLTELDSPIPEFGSNAKSIEKGLLRTFGEQIGKDLFGYYDEKR
jgi:hypothetical protein